MLTRLKLAATYAFNSYKQSAFNKFPFYVELQRRVVKCKLMDHQIFNLNVRSKCQAEYLWSFFSYCTYRLLFKLKDDWGLPRDKASVPQTYGLGMDWDCANLPDSRFLIELVTTEQKHWILLLTGYREKLNAEEAAWFSTQKLWNRSYRILGPVRIREDVIRTQSNELRPARLVLRKAFLPPLVRSELRLFYHKKNTFDIYYPNYWLNFNNEWYQCDSERAIFRTRDRWVNFFTQFKCTPPTWWRKGIQNQPEDCQLTWNESFWHQNIKKLRIFHKPGFYLELDSPSDDLFKQAHIPLTTVDKFLEFKLPTPWFWMVDHIPFLHLAQVPKSWLNNVKDLRLLYANEIPFLTKGWDLEISTKAFLKPTSLGPVKKRTPIPWWLWLLSIFPA
uniref:Uncharacterized protein n=1 Tax=Chromera velia TaxID=505693 RepID=D9IXG1_9ALVE|nr:hypothetical protein CHVEC_pgp009 [Chromera velia]ADJ66569.1 hypothetical protein [Chromera velia]